MKTPREIYAQYKIMPNLQLHQLRVAAVATLICGSVKTPVNTQDVVLACLFHDMGNILKFRLDQLPEFLEPEGLDYWENVKAEYQKKYGSEQHHATEAIARELGLPENVIGYIREIDFSKLDETLTHGSLENLICEYADMRVAPHGVLSMEGRLTEGRKRYLARGDAGKWMAESSQRFETLFAAGERIEERVFSESSMKPEDITDAAIAPVIEELWEYAVA